MKSSISCFQQLIQLIPRSSIGWVLRDLRDENEEARRAAQEKGAPMPAKFIEPRRFGYKDQIYNLVMGQALNADSLNEICDIAHVHEGTLSRTRGMVAPKLNTFSYANRTRDPAVIERVYWKLMDDFTTSSPGFARGKRKGIVGKFRSRAISAIDSTTIKLAANCIDWARYEHSRAAVKAHMRVDVASSLPKCVIITDARTHDVSQTQGLCADMKSGDIVIEDKGYFSCKEFAGLEDRGIVFVTREKSGFTYKVKEDRQSKHECVISDEVIEPAGRNASAAYSGKLRRVKAKVEIDGEMREMVFLTNNLNWEPTTVAELYKARWTIELFFKELKQTLQLKEFYGTNANAIKWQIWAAMICHLLLRYMKFLSKWKLSYTRLVGVTRTCLWCYLNLKEYLSSYGIADDDKPRPAAAITQDELPLTRIG